MLKDFSLNRMLVLFTAIGFFFFAIDSLLEHWEILGQDLPAFIPVAFSALGAIIAGVAAFRWTVQWQRGLQWLFVAAFLVSAAGLYYHIAEEDEEELASAETKEHEAKEKDKPLLAPLSFAGLAALGFMGTSRRWKTE